MDKVVEENLSGTGRLLTGQGSEKTTQPLAKRQLTEEELRQRQLPYAEASTEEKLRRVHLELLGVRDLALNQQREISRLLQHQHGPSGEMVQPFRRHFADAEGCAMRRDPLA